MKNKRPAARVNEYQNGGNEFKLFAHAGNSERVYSLQLCNLSCIKAASLCNTSIPIKPNLVLNCRLIDLKKDQPITIIFIHAGNFLLSELTKNADPSFAKQTSRSKSPTKRLISTSRQILTADWPLKAEVSAGIWTDWRQRSEWINLIGWQNLRKIELNNARSICVHESCTCKQTLPVHKSVHVIRINIINPAYAKNDIPISQTSRTAVAVKIHPDYDSETRGKWRKNYYFPASKKCEKS